MPKLRRPTTTLVQYMVAILGVSVSSTPIAPIISHALPPTKTMATVVPRPMRTSPTPSPVPMVCTKVVCRNNTGINPARSAATRISELRMRTVHTKEESSFRTTKHLPSARDRPCSLASSVSRSREKPCCTSVRQSNQASSWWSYQARPSQQLAYTPEAASQSIGTWGFWIQWNAVLQAHLVTAGMGAGRASIFGLSTQRIY